MKKIGELTIAAARVPVYEAAQKELAECEDGAHARGEYIYEGDLSIVLNSAMKRRGEWAHVLLHEIGHAGLRLIGNYTDGDKKGTRLYEEEVAVDAIAMAIAQNLEEIQRLVRLRKK